MARSHRVTVPVASTGTLIADSTTLGGGRNILIRATPTTDSFDIGGDENQSSDPMASGGTTLANNGGFTVPANTTITLIAGLEGNEKIYAKLTANNTNTMTVHIFRYGAGA